MGLFTSKKERAANARWRQRATDAAETARKEAEAAKKYQKRLASGQSHDPAADRYFSRRHDENRRLAEANARDWAANAGRGR